MFSTPLSLNAQSSRTEESKSNEVHDNLIKRLDGFLEQSDVEQNLKLAKPLLKILLYNVMKNMTDQNKENVLKSLYKFAVLWPKSAYSYEGDEYIKYYLCNDRLQDIEELYDRREFYLKHLSSQLRATFYIQASNTYLQLIKEGIIPTSERCVQYTQKAVDYYAMYLTNTTQTVEPAAPTEIKPDLKTIEQIALKYLSKYYLTGFKDRDDIETIELDKILGDEDVPPDMQLSVKQLQQLDAELFKAAKQGLGSFEEVINQLVRPFTETWLAKYPYIIRRCCRIVSDNTQIEVEQTAQDQRKAQDYDTRDWFNGTLVDAFATSNTPVLKFTKTDLQNLGKVDQYQQDLMTCRNYLKTELDKLKIAAGSVDDFFKVHTAYTIEIRKLLNKIFQDCQNLLGDLHCGFIILGEGSLTRADFCPASDIDMAILLEKEFLLSQSEIDNLVEIRFKEKYKGRFLDKEFKAQAKKEIHNEINAQEEKNSYRRHEYFQTLLNALTVKLICLRDRAFKVDTGSLAHLGKKAVINTGKCDFDSIGTSEYFSEHYCGPKIDYSQPEPYAKLRSVALSTNIKREAQDEKGNSLFSSYQNTVKDYLSNPVTTKGEELHRLHAENYLKENTRQFTAMCEKWDSPNEKTINIKERYLAPLVFFISDLGLYFGLWKKEGGLEAESHMILNLLEKNKYVALEFVHELRAALAGLQQLRIWQHFNWLELSDDCRFKRDEFFKDDNPQDTLGIPAEKLSAFILTQEQRLALAKIDRMVLQPAYQAIVSWLSEPQEERKPLDPPAHNLKIIGKGSPPDSSVPFDSTIAIQTAIDSLCLRQADAKPYLQTYSTLNKNFKPGFIKYLQLLLNKQPVYKKKVIDELTQIFFDNDNVNNQIAATMLDDMGEALAAINKIADKYNHAKMINDRDGMAGAITAFARLGFITEDFYKVIKALAKEKEITLNVKRWINHDFDPTREEYHYKKPKDTTYDPKTHVISTKAIGDTVQKAANDIIALIDAIPPIIKKIPSIKNQQLIDEEQNGLLLQIKVFPFPEIPLYYIRQPTAGLADEKRETSSQTVTVHFTKQDSDKLKKQNIQNTFTFLNTASSTETTPQLTVQLTDNSQLTTQKNSFTR